MEEEFKVIEKLTSVQKAELDKDIQELYGRLQEEPDFKQGRVVDVNVNMNLLNEVFLNLTLKFGEISGDKVNGKITQVYQYEDKSEYIKAINT